MASLKWSVLFAVAGGCGIGVGCMYVLLNKERQHFASNKVFIKSAVRLMNDTPQVMQLLGYRFDVGKATFLNDSFGKMDSPDVRVKVPIKGEEDNAELLAYARRDPEDKKLDLYRLEMTFDKVKGKKLILIDESSKQKREESISPAKEQAGSGKSGETHKSPKS